MSGAFRFNYTVDVTELRQVSRPLLASLPELVLYTIIVEEGVACIQDQAMQVVTGTLQIDPLLLPVQYKTFDEKWETMYGAGVIDSIKYATKRVGELAKKGISAAAPYVTDAIKMALPTLLGPAGLTMSGALELLEKFGAQAGMAVIKKLAKMNDKSSVLQIEGSGMCGGNMYGSGMVGGKGKKKVKGGAATSKSEMSKFLRDF